MNHSPSHIEECLRLIENQFHRGSREDWTSYDFEKLNVAIFEATGVMLSVSTLKRLFGKVSYTNLPAIHTLNTLARFAGFDDWNEFRRKHPVAGPPPLLTPVLSSALPVTPLARTSRRLNRWWPVLFLPLAILWYSLLSSRNSGTHPPADPRNFSFSCNKVLSEGVPNSVIFHYHSPVGPNDSVFISQTWDLRRRTTVPPKGSDFSAIYYYPGFFNAKLIIDTQIVRTHDLMISSDGWLATTDAERGPVPIYFKKEEIERKEGIEVDSSMLARYHLVLQPKAPLIRLFNIQDMGHLSNADFGFETTLRTGFAEGAGKCQYVQVLIQCKNDIIIIPLAAKPCIGDLDLYFAGAHASSATADLSGFGADLTHWTTLRVSSHHQFVTFFVNDKPAYSLTFHDDPTDIVGVQYRFSGTCAVKNARFTGGDRVIQLK